MAAAKGEEKENGGLTQFYHNSAAAVKWSRLIFDFAFKKEGESQDAFQRFYCVCVALRTTFFSACHQQLNHYSKYSVFFSISRCQTTENHQEPGTISF